MGLQAGLMDRETVAVTIPELAPGESRTVDLVATYNRGVFETEGTLSVTGEVMVDYIARDRPVSQTAPVTYDLYDKTALTWDDNAKVGAFITHQDSALNNYSSTIRQYTKDYANPGIPEALQTAMQLYAGLMELGILYEKDPTSPFDLAQENPIVVDNISLPRETLKSASGDCDDLTVLYCALLETVGIQTGYITTPGHIYSVFNTKVPSNDHRSVHPDGSMTIGIDGELWVPVEITLLGSDDFLSAWRYGAQEYALYDDNPQMRDITMTSDAQVMFRPVTLLETDLGLQYGSRMEIVRQFEDSVDRLAETIIGSFRENAEENPRKEAYNRVGIVAAQLQVFDEAEAAFNEALRLDRNYLAPKINLANIYYMSGDLHESLRVLHSAESDLLARSRPSARVLGTVYLNLSRTYYELENFARATEYSDSLAEVDPELAAEFAYLRVETDDSGARAASAQSRSNLLFVTDEE